FAGKNVGGQVIAQSPYGRNVINAGINVLRTWASMGAELRAARSRGVPDWQPVHRMVEVTRPKLIAEAERLRTLLDQSRQLLAPLSDPFDVDLGLHRWLDSEREEAYSDWLEWVVRQAKEANAVFKLLNLGVPPEEANSDQQLQVQRECCV